MVREPNAQKPSTQLEVDPNQTPEEAKAAEIQQAKDLAARCRLQYVDLEHFQPDHDLFRSVPVELMFRYDFLPYRKENDNLVIVTSDPTNAPSPLSKSSSRGAKALNASWKRPRKASPCRSSGMTRIARTPYPSTG